VDVGSGYDVCNAHLESALQAVATERGESSVWDSLTHVLITHAHIDHYGGLGFVRQRTRAPIGVHELDAPVLSDFQAQRARAVQITDRFLRLAGA
jgi:glyoxylase-like metal-dependent hydrolase (beta-lactamase superfamily II)